MGIAFPLIISCGVWSLMYFFDRMFLMWHAKEAMAASMPAGVFYFMLICLPLGVAMYTNTFVSQYYGAGMHHRIGPAVWQGAGLGLVLMPVYWLITPWGEQIFTLFGHTPTLVDNESIYFRFLMYGSGAAIASESLSAFFVGRGKNHVVMMVNVVTVLLNIVLDYALIFGAFGLPAWGIAGAGAATTAAHWFRVAFLLGLMFLDQEPGVDYQLARGMRFDRDLFFRMLRFGGPNGFQIFAEIAAFSLFIMVIGSLSDNAMAATTIAFNMNTLGFMPLLGIGIAVMTIVGRQLGDDRPDLAERGTYSAFILGTIYMGVLAVLFVTIPDVLLMGYAWFSDPEQFAAIRQPAIVLMRFVAAYTFFDAQMVIFVNAIKGAGDTRFVLLVSILMAPLLLLGCWVGIAFFGLGLYWCWSVLSVWIFLCGVIYFRRFRRGKWRTMRVIESPVVPFLEEDESPIPEDGPSAGSPTTA
jgi:MATE family multidrug resistance protein